MIRFQPSNAQHVGNRENQQDSFGFSDIADAAFSEHGGFVAIVCDGMGGLAKGDQASKIAVKQFLESYRNKPQDEAIPNALERSARAANAAVVEFATREGTPGEIGTTLVAAVFESGGLHWISIGDSGLFLHRKGDIFQINASHTYANVLDVRAFRGEITRELALSDPQREALTSYVGSRDLREIDQNFRPFPVDHGDVFTLASDGLFKTLTLDRIAGIVDEHPDSAADRLIQQTLAAHRQHQDNVTVCLVQAIDSGRAVPALPQTKRLGDTQELPVAQKSGGKKLVQLLVAALALAAGAVGGYFGYQRYFAPAPAKVVVTPASDAKEAPVSDDPKVATGEPKGTRKKKAKEPSPEPKTVADDPVAAPPPKEPVPQPVPREPAAAPPAGRTVAAPPAARPAPKPSTKTEPDLSPGK